MRSNRTTSIPADTGVEPPPSPDVASGERLYPIDFHCHGVGRADFTNAPSLSLRAVEQSLAAAGVRSILTLYVPRPHFAAFIELVEAFDRGRKAGKYRHVVGIAMEGPLLASHGGTPAKGVWCPSQAQWKRLAALGPSGLRYIVFSPDYQLSEGRFDATDGPPDVEWLVDCLLDGGVLPALGHFVKFAPEASAAAVQRILARVEQRGDGPVVTDHLYNDMPLNFRHAWRTAEGRRTRAEDLSKLDLDGWRLDNLVERIGPVPAAILAGAQRGSVRVCLNFDGEHVDLAISKRTVDLVGSDKFLLMTDRIESRLLAGQRLFQRDDSTLLYQRQGIVAGGSQSVLQQVNNMRAAGFGDRAIRDITTNVAADLLKLPRVFEREMREAAPQVAP